MTYQYQNKAGQKKGPFDLDELTALFRGGLISLDTPVYTGESSESTTLSSVIETTPALPAPEPTSSGLPNLCPNCKQPVVFQAFSCQHCGRSLRVIRRGNPFRYMAQCFKLYGRFSGRSTRIEYWSFTLITSLFAAALILASILCLNFFSVDINAIHSYLWNFVQGTANINDVVTIEGPTELVLSFLCPFFFVSGILVLLVTFVPAMAVACRRLHDTGTSGLYLLLNLLPGIGQIVLFIMLLRNSSRGANKYGPATKYP